MTRENLPPRKSNVSLGENLRKIRALNGWSLSDIQTLTGIPLSTLSKVENGKSTLSFERLILLVERLGINFDSLVDPEKSSLPKASRSITRSGNGIRHVEAGNTFEFLSADLTASRNIAFKVTVSTPRETGARAPFNRHLGEEFIYVLSGTLVLLTEYYEPLSLKPGDSILFDASMRHSYTCGEDGPAEVIMVNEKYITPGSSSVFDLLKERNSTLEE